ncbi:CHAT domain-containing protein [Glycomyces paridis]|uniref:CHAT domain-containing protein n=1 Tax=Glycomyces paridis TaxID=2126555 RepID=A0A4S8P8D0_9ACTN|nr:CHAT domain-containing protein [Glycomyces paridis]THV26460.1 CHAT domain-containing protein [Glycomyces paridis]
MRSRDELNALLDQALTWISDSRDPSLAWAPGITALAEHLKASLVETRAPDVQARLRLGWLAWHQAASAPRDDIRDEKIAEALELLTDCAVAALGVFEFPAPLLPALADRAAPRILDMINYAVAEADTRLFTDLVEQWRYLVSVTPEAHPELARRLAWTCGMLVARHQMTAAPADLDDAIDIGRLAVELGASDSDLGIHLSNLSAAHKTRYDLHREAADLDSAIDAARRATAITSGPEVLAPATNLCGALILRFERDRDDTDLAEAVRFGRIAAAQARSGLRDAELALYNLADALKHQYDSAASPSVLIEAIRIAEAAVQAGEGRPDTAMRLDLLADLLQSKSALTSSKSDLDAAIAAARRAAETGPATSRTPFHRLAGLLFDRTLRFTAENTKDELDELVAVNRHLAAEATAAFNLTSLSLALLTRFANYDDEADLDEAVDAARRGVAFDPATRGGGREALEQLARTLHARWERHSDIRDLDELVATRQTLVEPGTAAPDPSEAWSSLGLVLFTRHKALDESADQESVDRESTDHEAAVHALREALATAPDTASRVIRRADLSCVLYIGYRSNHRRSDLEDAADLARAAAADAPAESSPELLYNLAVVLHDRARKSGDLPDLDLSISLARKALTAHGRPDATLRGHLQVTRTRANQPSSAHIGPEDLHVMLEDYLAHRFEWTNTKADVDALVRLRREAAANWDGEGRSGAGDPRALAGALKRRFLLTRDVVDLDEAIGHYREALDRHPGSATLLVPLSDALRHRARMGAGDLDEALDLARRAVRLQSWSHAYGNLSMILLDRFRNDRHRHEELAEAVDAARKALHADPEDLDRPKWLHTLGEILLERVRYPDIAFDPRGDAGREADRTEGLRVLAELARSPLAPPLYRVHAAKGAGWLAINAVETAREASDYDPEEFTLAADLLAVAVGLLPEIAPRRMARGEQQEAMASMAGIAGDAATLTLLDPSRPARERARRALALLEQGRAVLVGRALDTRGGIAGLRAADPELAARFTTLRDALDRGADLAAEGEHDRTDAAADLEAVLREIRRLDGFADFATPPEIDDLLAAADQGPIVCLNVASSGTALLITAGDVTALDLPGVDAAAVIDQANAFHVALRKAHDLESDRTAAQSALLDTLEWLWDKVTGPVLDALGIGAPADPGTPLPRIWWAPGGYLGLLPLHAAGHHTDAESGRTVLDRAVSSYTPTVKALRHARQRQAAVGAARGVLIVPMPTTPGLPDLRHVADETELLADLLPDALVLQAPDRASALAALPGRAIAHFACHGSFDLADPAASGLLLNDHAKRPLTAADLGAIDLDGAALAYLSACHTAVNATEALLDEGIHLAASMQAAGFPQVIATLWEVDDEIAVEIADDCYTGLIDGTGRPDAARAARSLHSAVRTQRDRYRGTPSLWASHLHFGA